MSKLDAARAARDMMLRKEAKLKCSKEKAIMTIKIKEMQKHISLIHKENKGIQYPFIFFALAAYTSVYEYTEDS